MTKCPKCNQVVSVDDYEINWDSHNLWNHPTDDQIQDTVDQIASYIFEIQDKLDIEQFVSASFLGSDLANAALLFKRQMEAKAGV